MWNQNHHAANATCSKILSSGQQHGAVAISPHKFIVNPKPNTRQKVLIECPAPREGGADEEIAAPMAPYISKSTVFTLP